MARFTTVLGPGRESPYDTWTFLIFPDDVAAAWGPGRFVVHLTINGVTVSGFAAWGEGMLRIPLAAPVRAALGVAPGDRVTVEVARADAEPPLTVPPALQALLETHAALRSAFTALPPSAQRAWAAHIADAKRPQTLARRLEQAQTAIPARQYPR
jgi:hypothetical protein